MVLWAFARALANKLVGAQPEPRSGFASLF
jgi:hypothetical protein